MRLHDSHLSRHNSCMERWDTCLARRFKSKYVRLYEGVNSVQAKCCLFTGSLTIYWKFDLYFFFFQRCLAQGTPMPVPLAVKNCIQLASCDANQLLPMNPELPADLFTSCLSTPIKVALRWWVFVRDFNDILFHFHSAFNKHRHMM